MIALAEPPDARDGEAVQVPHARIEGAIGPRAVDGIQRGLVELGMSRGLYHLRLTKPAVAADHHADAQLPLQVARRRVHPVAVVLHPAGPVVDVARLGGALCGQLGRLAGLPR